jgi:D12 class N6 adenine-specific DNA methyltransferase
MKEPDQRGHLIHFTPLRYPGGKAKLAEYVKSLMKENRLLDGEYVEPYAGGAAIGLELLFHEYVSRIHINDVSNPVHAFWKSVLRHTEELCRLVSKTPLTVVHRDTQKSILEKPAGHSDLELGFATFFLNRTNRSGILNGGIIGGRDQDRTLENRCQVQCERACAPHRGHRQNGRPDQINSAGRLEISQSWRFKMAEGNPDLSRSALLRERPRSLLRLLRAERPCQRCRLRSGRNYPATMDRVV